MGRLSSIEEALVQINGTVFQELCDSFLVLRNENYSAFSRTGSQSGKQKTVKGNPDSFFLLPSGEYFYVEHTTRSQNQKSKLEKDIKSCLEDAEESNIPLEKIREIILCTNFSLNTDEIQDLNELLSDTNISLTVWTLDSLAIEIKLNHRNLAHEYLGLPLDTGQVVSLKQFLKEYERASQGIATPLDNEFLHREEEVKEITASLNNKDFVILKGSAGVGKTKLAIETIRNYLRENKSYQAYCISYKNYDLLEDLYQYFDEEKDYILFVDDANRIDAFNQITEFYKTDRSGSLKLLITVRDYAYEEIRRICQNFDLQKIEIDKLSDEEIKDIIESDSFEVKNPDYQKEIFRIADGNPRLAIMASLLALKEQNIAALADVSDLFEKYFSTFIKDDGEFESDINIKTLGILGFFGTVQFKNRELIEPILEKFGLSFSEFIDAINKLEKLELIQIKYEHVKIPEQNLSMFFFYKAFIKNELLDFRVLLDEYFDTNTERIKECVIQANNTFGNQRVMKKIRPDLNSYWERVKKDQDEAFRFLNVFWFYMPDEALGFAYDIIKEMDKNGEIENNAINNILGLNEPDDQIIELVGNFLRFPEKIEEALEILFVYAHKNPSLLSILVKKITQTLSFEHKDQYINFKRQKNLFDYIIQKVSTGDYLFTTSLMKLSKFFLGFRFERHENERGNKVVFYKYPIPATEEIKQIRSNIWRTLDKKFDESESAVFDVLKDYHKGEPDPQEEILQYDLPFVLDIVNENLSNESFEHCHYVHELIAWYERNDITDKSFNELKSSFTNRTYETYREVKWDYFEDETIDSDDHREYDKKKEERLRSKFVFNSIEEFNEFYENYIQVENYLSGSFFRSLGFIIHENFKQNFCIGYEILKYLISKDNDVNYLPIQVFSDCLDDKKKEEEVWKLISSYEYKRKTEWNLIFFKDLKNKELEKENFLIRFFKWLGIYSNNNITVHEFLSVYKSIKNPITLRFDKLVRFNSIYPNLFNKILKIVTRKIDNEGTRIKILRDLFSDHIEELRGDYELIKKAYLQQSDINEHFDPSSKGLVQILSSHKKFLLDYVKHMYSKDKYKQPSTHLDLSGIWALESIENEIKDAFNWIADNEVVLRIDKHFCNVFFKNLKDEEKETAKKFLLDYIKENYDEPNRIEIAIDVIRESFEDLFEEGVRNFISLNQNIEDFKKISWFKSGDTIIGNVNFGDIRAAKWKKLLSIVEKSDLGIKILPIKNYLKRRIKSELQFAESEKQRRFVRGI